MRLIDSYTAMNKSARVYHNREWEEYVVRFYADGLHLDGADYHTPDKQEAIDTAKIETFNEMSFVEMHS